MKLVLALLFYFTGGPAFADAPKVLRIGMVGEPNSLNPIFRGSSEEGFVIALTNRSASHFDADSELVPHLAKEKPVFKKNELCFEIREKAVWNDGVPVTCEDFQTALMADRKFKRISDFKVEGVAWDKETPKKCRIKYKVRKPTYTVYLAVPVPTHLEKKIIESSENEIEYLKKTNFAVNPTLKGLSSGPFQMLTYKPGYYFEYERNPLFYGKKPVFEKIQVRFFKDQQSTINAYQTNDIDLIISGLTANRIQELQNIFDQKKRFGKLIARATTKLTHLEFNLEKKPMSDVKIRQALSMLIDPKELKTIIGEDGEITGSLFYFNDPLFSEKMAKPSYTWDKTKATKLLIAAGYSKNENGKWIDKNQIPLSIDLFFNSESTDREKVALYLQNQWDSFGIKINLKKNIKRVLRFEYMKKGNFDVAIFGWSQPKLQIQTMLFGKDSIPTEANNWIGPNYSRWNNPKAEAQIRAADAEFELPKIKKHIDKFLIDFRSELPWLILYFENRTVVVPKDLQNYQIFPDWEPETYDIENWSY